METPTFPFTAASFNQLISQKKLAGSRCTQCGALYLPPKAICSKCHSSQLEWVEFSGRGKLAAFTSIFVPPSDMVKMGYGRDNPYISGIVALEEGVQISARILGLNGRKPAEIKIGTPLMVEFREHWEADSRTVEMVFRAE